MTSCTPKPDGTNCLTESDWKNCRPWDLTQQSRTNCYIDSLTQEALDIAGAHLNVFKLLGVHEQTKLVDLTGDGQPLSGGTAPGYNPTDAFNTFKTEWRSRQTGSKVASTAFIGYDFGAVKIPNGRQRYGIDANIRQHITALKIKQSANPLNRVTKARVERSDNGKDWYGVAVVTLPNDDALNTIHFKHSVPNRYWRLRPITFVGGDCDNWGVQALQLFDYSVTHISNIQDKVLLENRDRDYQDSAVALRGYYEIPTRMLALMGYGSHDDSLQYNIRVNFNSCVALLGRPLIIGDIIELPSETQYRPDMTPVKLYVEVTDVSWDTQGYTPGWSPTMLFVVAEPALASQETQKIFGDLANKYVDNSGLYATDDGSNTKYQDFSTIDQYIAAQSKTKVPERGAEGSNAVREFSVDEVNKADAQGFPHLNRLGLNANGLYVEDAMPKNGEPYTEGPEFPAKPKDGDYHRLTYTGLAKDVPAILQRWSEVKNRWIYMQTDRRAEYNAQGKVLEEYTRGKNKKFAGDIK